MRYERDDKIACVILVLLLFAALVVLVDAGKQNDELRKQIDKCLADRAHDTPQGEYNER